VSGWVSGLRRTLFRCRNRQQQGEDSLSIKTGIGNSNSRARSAEHEHGVSRNNPQLELTWSCTTRCTPASSGCQRAFRIGSATETCDSLRLLSRSIFGVGDVIEQAIIGARVARIARRVTSLARTITQKGNHHTVPLCSTKLATEGACRFSLRPSLCYSLSPMKISHLIARLAPAMRVKGYSC